jgi:MFS family permease
VGDRRSLLTMWLAWLVLMASVQLPAPLYDVYAHRFDFSTLVLTLVFAVYAVGVLAATLLFGRLSDRFGRRPVLLAGLATGCLGALLFAVADGTAWLFAARIVQGLAVGTVSGPATAALVEAAPEESGQLAALLAGLAQTVGSAVGPLAAGVLAEWAVDPLHLSFWLVLVLLLVAIAVVARLPEPGTLSTERWRVQWPRVPAGLRADFTRVSLTAALVWGAVALYLSVLGADATSLLHSHDLAVLGAVSALALAASSAAQLVSSRSRWRSVRAAQAVGLGLLAVGLAGLLLVAVFPSLGLLLASALVAGAGHGLGFLNAQHELNELAPRLRRGEVTSAYICCIYLVVVASVVGSGLLALAWPLSTAVAVVAVVLAVAAAGVAAWQLRAVGVRPRA